MGKQLSNVSWQEMRKRWRLWRKRAALVIFALLSRASSHAVGGSSARAKNSPVRGR